MILRKVILGLCCAVCLSAHCDVWQPDILGHGLEMRCVDQGRDYAGSVRCTIVRLLSDCDDGSRRGVLYIHGFNDYFFQWQMAERFIGQCYDFYAVDLRKYGRSIMTGQRKFDCRSMKEYFADIDSALLIMQSSGVQDIVLMGHSTGGLLAAYYVKSHPSAPVKALILNSPFLDWNLGKLEGLVPLVSALGSVMPDLRIKQGNSTVYCESLDSLRHGEWGYNHDWKQCKSPDVTAGWVRAIDNAQRELKKYPYKIKVPILLMYSSCSYDGSEWSKEAQKSDVVLDVSDIKRLGVKLGTTVTAVQVNDGMHDLLLSAPPVRSAVYNYIFCWLQNK